MTWTGQSFSVGQILTAAQMTNLQADITAAFNKDSGAPVLKNNYIVTAMLGGGAVTVSKLANAAAGSYASAKSSVVASTASTSYTKLKEIRAAIGGTYTVAFSIYIGGTSNTVTGRIYKNGTAVGTEQSTTSNTPVEYTENLTVAAGDLIQIYIKTSDAAVDAYVSDFELREANPLVAVVTLD